MAKESSIPGSPVGFGSRFAAITVDWFACSLIVNGLTGRNYGYEGERLFRLKVIDSETGLALSPLRILIRTLLIILVLPALFRRDGIAYHDYICKSVVVRR